MPRRKVEVKTGARIEKLRAEAEGLAGLDKALLDDLLVEYDALSSMVDTLRKSVEEHGVMVEKEVGSVNNRHIELVENPEFTSYSKALKVKSEISRKLSDFARRSDDEAEEEDELDAFLRR